MCDLIFMSALLQKSCNQNSFFATVQVVFRSHQYSELSRPPRTTASSRRPSKWQTRWGKSLSQASNHYINRCRKSRHGKETNQYALMSLQKRPRKNESAKYPLSLLFFLLDNTRILPHLYHSLSHTHRPLNVPSVLLPHPSSLFPSLSPTYHIIHL